MAHNINSVAKTVKSVAPLSCAGAFTTTEVSAAGFGRARFVLNVGAMGNTGTLDMAIHSATTTGGSFANTGLTGAVLTQIADTGGGKVYCIDIAVPAARPFLKAILTGATAASVAGVTCDLYNGTRTMTPSASFEELVTV